MVLVVIIDFVVVGVLVFLALTKGLESTLPFFAFVIISLPVESQFQVPGLLDVTTQRVAIVTLAILYMILGHSKTKIANTRGLPLKYLILVNIAWSLVATLNSVVFTISLKTVLSQVFDYFLIYYLFVQIVTNIRTVNRIIFAIVAAMFVCCVLGLFEEYYSWSVIGLFPKISYRFGESGGIDLDITRGLRVHSTYPHPILFGAALTMAMPLAFYLLTVAQNNARKIFLWATIMLMFLNIYKTMSRGPWIALLISLILLFLFSEAKMHKYLSFVGLLTVMVLVVRPGVRDTIKDTYLATLDPDTAEGVSYQWRYALIHVGREALAKDVGRSLWGYGPESFYFLGLQTEFQGKIVKAESCDNALVWIMVGTGYVGLFLTALLLFKPALISLASFIKLPKPNNLLCLVLFVNMAAYCFLMTNVMLYGWGQQTYTLWIIAALAVKYPRLVARLRTAQDVLQMANPGNTLAHAVRC
jgi:hypothetical protein